MRVFLFCPAWEPTGNPPALVDQLADNGWRRRWEPERCHFSINGEGDHAWDNTYDWGWGITGAQAARNARCLTHPRQRPRGYLRMWTAQRHWQARILEFYRQRTIRNTDIPGWEERFGGRGLDNFMVACYERIRPPARTIHVNWQ